MRTQLHPPQALYSLHMATEPTTSSGSEDRSRSPLRTPYSGSVSVSVPGPGQGPRPCCSCNQAVETWTDLNWLNMGPDRASTPLFWSRVGTVVYLDWQSSVSGDYGLFLPMCRNCMRSMRQGLNRLLYTRELRGADEICIHMLCEQLYFKAQQLPASVDG